MGEKTKTYREKEGVIGTEPPSWMAAHPPLIILQASFKKQIYPYIIKYNTSPRRGKFVLLFVETPDEHAAFVTSLHLDGSFAMEPRALCLDLDRVKSASGFEAQTDQTRLPQFRGQTGQTLSHDAARHD